MEDLLPILIGVVWFAYKMYQGAQKKANNQKKPIIATPKVKEEITPTFEPNVDDFVKTFFGIPPQKPEPVSDNYNSYTVEDEYSEVEKNYFSNTESVETGYNTYTPKTFTESIEYDQFSSLNKKTPISVEIENTEEIKELKYKNEIFDLRKAIIYDAILNRPYV